MLPSGRILRVFVVVFLHLQYYGLQSERIVWAWLIYGAKPRQHTFTYSQCLSCFRVMILI